MTTAVPSAADRILEEGVYRTLEILDLLGDRYAGGDGEEMELVAEVWNWLKLHGLLVSVTGLSIAVIGISIAQLQHDMKHRREVK